jgi:hypothetical protein
MGEFDIKSLNEYMKILLASSHIGFSFYSRIEEKFPIIKCYTVLDSKLDILQSNKIRIFPFLNGINNDLFEFKNGKNLQLDETLISNLNDKLINFKSERFTEKNYFLNCNFEDFGIDIVIIFIFKLKG